MLNTFKNKKILITGGTGSIGSAALNEILKLKCKTIRVLGSDENGLHNLSLKLSNKNENFFKLMKRNKIRFIYGDITDQNRMYNAMEDIDIVIHAAAMKHVPICEYNPFEATKVNVLGTENLIRAALSRNINKFLFISTDKVVDPTTCLGATKLLAEKIVLNSNLTKGKKKTLFSVVRFGNVIGTRGSVLPKFIEQLKSNSKITLTDKISTRFFVTVNDAVNAIIKSIDLMKGGEIFLPKTINAIKIHDLVLALNKIYKFSKSKVILSGLRAGEKVHEGLITEKEYNYLKQSNNIYIIDQINKHKFKKIKTKVKYFNSENANILKVSQIINYLKKNNLLN